MLQQSTVSLLESLTPISQGAEAKVYQHALHGPEHAPLLIKYRFSKKYRHGNLDAALTRARTTGEARMLLRCLRSGVHVPGVRMVDAPAGVLGLEWIEGHSVRALLCDGEEGMDEDDGQDPEVPPVAIGTYGVPIDEVMRMMGIEIAKMHHIDVVHGDLTTSNMMLRSLPIGSPELVLIDFGLSFVSNLVEDKAVDLYVLERAFASTHPDSEPLFVAVLEAYAKHSGKAWGAISKRLDAGAQNSPSLDPYDHMALCSTVTRAQTKHGRVVRLPRFDGRHNSLLATCDESIAPVIKRI